jgi:hypothetical protein
MISIVKDKDGNIKTFSESLLEDYNKSLGESIELLNTTLQEYSRRFMLSIEGITGQTFSIGMSEFDLTVIVSTNLDLVSVDVDINGVTETIPLTEGKGHIILSTYNPGTFIITPADRKTFCAAGNGLLVVEVQPNE